MSATSYLRKKVMDHLTGVTTYSSPTLYLSLHSADPGPTGSHAAEISDSSYHRQSLAGIMGAADATTGISVNTSVINFSPATVEWDVRYFGIEDALTSGNMLIPGIPSLPKIVAAGSPFQLAPGQLRLRLT
jgi:hypothetical protein